MTPAERDALVLLLELQLQLRTPSASGGPDAGQALELHALKMQIVREACEPARG